MNPTTSTVSATTQTDLLAPISPQFSGATAGSIRYRGQPLSCAIRRQIQLVFQEPYDSLNPRMTVSRIIEEPRRYHDHEPRHKSLGQRRQQQDRQE